MNIFLWFTWVNCEQFSKNLRNHRNVLSSCFRSAGGNIHEKFIDKFLQTEKFYFCRSLDILSAFYVDIACDCLQLQYSCSNCTTCTGKSFAGVTESCMLDKCPRVLRNSDNFRILQTSIYEGEGWRGSENEDSRKYISRWMLLMKWTFENSKTSFFSLYIL